MAQAVSGTAGAAGGSKLEEVTVTAEKRRVNAQKTSIEVTALSSADIQKKGVTSLDNLQYATPAVTVANVGDIHVVNIRGLGLGIIGPETSSGVINYRDGVLITHEPFLLDPYYDTDNIQVLEGPQGTLAGSNSTGGAVFYNSKNPDFTGVNGYFQQSIGAYDDVHTEGAVNVPVNDKLALRIASSYESRNSYWRSVQVPGVNSISSNTTPGAMNQNAVRLSALYKPLSDLTFLLKTEYGHYYSTGIAGQPSPYSDYYAYAPHTPFELSYNTPTMHEQYDWRSILQVDWQFSDFAELRSQTAWTQGFNHENDDSDESAYNGQSDSYRVNFSTFQQEIDLLSTGKSALQWSVGGFTYADKTVGPFNIYNNGTPQAPLPFTLNIVPSGTSGAYTEAGFGQATYSITDQFQVFGGLRYTNDKRDSDGGISINPGNVYINNSGVYERATTSGKIGVNWLPDANNLIYVFAAKGTKAGGINTGVPAQFANFAPEKVYDYEIGWKSTLFDHHLRFQLNGFYNDYHGFQLNVYNPTTLASYVAGTTSPSTIKGVEASAQGVVGAWDFDGNFAYVDSALGPQVLYDTRYAPAIPVQLNGKPLPFSPHITANGGIDYNYAISEGTLRPRIQAEYIGGQWETPFEIAGRDWVSSRFLVDARLTWQPNDRWQVEAYAQNLFNKVYIQAISSSSTTDNRLYGDPRTYGVRGSYKF